MDYVEDMQVVQGVEMPVESKLDKPEKENTIDCPLCPIEPGPTTIRAIKAARRGEFVGKFKTAKEMFEFFDARR